MKYEMKLCVIKISVNSRLEEVLNQVTCRSEMDIEVLQSFEEFSAAVSYTHLTLPTNREV